VNEKADFIHFIGKGRKTAYDVASLVELGEEADGEEWIAFGLLEH
jgi:hypothetical protein